MSLWATKFTTWKWTWSSSGCKIGNFLNGLEYFIDIGVTKANYNGNYDKNTIKKNIELYEKSKINKYKDKMDLCSDSQVYFPVILQENGLMNDNFNILLNKLALSAAKKYAKIKSVMKSYYAEKYSAILCKYNAYSIIQHLNLVAML